MQKMSKIDLHFRMCNVFKIRSTVSLVPTSGLQPDLKELGPFSGTPTRPKGTWSFLWDSNPDSRTLTQTELGSQILQSYPRKDSNLT